jgi:hypothetical protein
VDASELEKIFKQNVSGWLAVTGVIGAAVAYTDEGPCIQVFVSADPETFDGRFPPEVEGLPVRVERREEPGPAGLAKPGGRRGRS